MLSSCLVVALRQGRQARGLAGSGGLWSGYQPDPRGCKMPSEIINEGPRETPILTTSQICQRYSSLPSPQSCGRAKRLDSKPPWPPARGLSQDGKNFLPDMTGPRVLHSLSPPRSSRQRRPQPQSHLQDSCGTPCQPPARSALSRLSFCKRGIAAGHPAPANKKQPPQLHFRCCAQLCV